MSMSDTVDPSHGPKSLSAEEQLQHAMEDILEREMAYIMSVPGPITYGLAEWVRDQAQPYYRQLKLRGHVMLSRPVQCLWWSLAWANPLRLSPLNTSHQHFARRHQLICQATMAVVVERRPLPSSARKREDCELECDACDGVPPSRPGGDDQSLLLPVCGEHHLDLLRLLLDEHLLSTPTTLGLVKDDLGQEWVSC